MSKEELEKLIKELNEILEQMIPVWEKTKTAELPAVLPLEEKVKRLIRNLEEVLSDHDFFRSYEATKEIMEKK